MINQKKIHFIFCKDFNNADGLAFQNQFVTMNLNTLKMYQCLLPTFS